MESTHWNRVTHSLYHHGYSLGGQGKWKSGRDEERVGQRDILAVAGVCGAYVLTVGKGLMNI